MLSQSTAAETIRATLALSQAWTCSTAAPYPTRLHKYSTTRVALFNGRTACQHPATRTSSGSGTSLASSTFRRRSPYRGVIQRRRSRGHTRRPCASFLRSSVCVASVSLLRPATMVSVVETAVTHLEMFGFTLCSPHHVGVVICQEAHKDALPLRFFLGPWVTSVGGTMNHIPEEVGMPLSGGGFSQYFGRPLYQNVAVTAFLQNLGNQYTGLYACVRCRNSTRLIYTLRSVQRWGTRRPRHLCAGKPFRVLFRR